MTWLNEQTAITDYDDPALLDTIRRNLASAPAHGPARVIGHTWATASTEDVLEASPLTERGYDILLAADVCWDAYVGSDDDALIAQLLPQRPVQVGLGSSRAAAGCSLPPLRRLPHRSQRARSLVCAL